MSSSISPLHSPPPLEAIPTNRMLSEARQPSSSSSPSRAAAHASMSNGEHGGADTETRQAAVVQRLTNTVEQQRARIRELVLATEKKDAATTELRGLFESLTRDYEEASRTAQNSALALDALKSHAAAVEEALALSKATVTMQQEKIQHFNDEWAAKTDHLRTQFALVVEEKTAAEAQRDELLEGHRVLRGESERLHREVESLRTSFESRLAREVQETTAALRQAQKAQESRLQEREEAVQRETRRLDEGMYRVESENTAARESKDVLRWRLTEMEKVVAAKTQLHEQLTRAMETLREEHAQAQRVARTERENQDRRHRALTEGYQTQLTELNHLLDQLKHEKAQGEKTARLACERLTQQAEDAQDRHRTAMASAERREQLQRDALKHAREALTATETKLSAAQAQAHQAVRAAEAHADRDAHAQETEKSLREAVTSAERRAASLQSRVDVLLHRLSEKETETELYRCTLERGMWQRALAWAEATGQTLLDTTLVSMTDDNNTSKAIAAPTRTAMIASVPSDADPLPSRLARQPSGHRTPTKTPTKATTKATGRNSSGISVLTIRRGTGHPGETGEMEDDDDDDEHTEDEEEQAEEEDELSAAHTSHDSESDQMVCFDDDLLQRCARQESQPGGRHHDGGRSTDKSRQGHRPRQGAPRLVSPTSAIAPGQGRPSAARPARATGRAPSLTRTPPRSHSAHRISRISSAIAASPSAGPSPFSSPPMPPRRALLRTDVAPPSPFTRPPSEARASRALPPRPSTSPPTPPHALVHPLNLVLGHSPLTAGLSPSALHSPWSPHVPSVTSSTPDGRGADGGGGGGGGGRRIDSAVTQTHPHGLAQRPDVKDARDGDRDGGERPRTTPPLAQAAAPLRRPASAEVSNQSLGSARYYKDDEEGEEAAAAAEPSQDGQVSTSTQQQQQLWSRSTNSELRARKRSRHRHGSGLRATRPSPVYGDPEALIRATIDAVLAHAHLPPPQAHPRPPTFDPQHMPWPHNTTTPLAGANSADADADEAGLDTSAVVPPAGRLFLSTTNTSQTTTQTRASEGPPRPSCAAPPSLVSGFVPPPRLGFRPTAESEATTAASLPETSLQSDQVDATGYARLPAPHTDANKDNSNSNNNNKDREDGRVLPPPPHHQRHARAPSSVRSDTPLSDVLHEQDERHSDAAVSARVQVALADVEPVVRAWEAARSVTDRYVHSTLDELVERQKKLLTSVMHEASPKKGLRTSATVLGRGRARSSVSVLSSMDTNDVNEALFATYDAARKVPTSHTRSKTRAARSSSASSLSSPPPRHAHPRGPPADRFALDEAEEDRTRDKERETAAAQTPTRLSQPRAPIGVPALADGEVSPLTVDVLQKHFSTTFKLPIP